MLHAAIGRRETGKTTLVMYLARQQPSGARLVFDPRNGIAPRAGGRKVFTIDDLVDDAYPQLYAGATPEVIYTPRENNLRESFAAWSLLVQHHIETRPGRTLSVVVDECALVQSDLESLDHPLQAAMRWSKRDRVHFFLTCHQPKNVPTNTRAICDYLIFFHATQEHDLRVIAERCSESFAGDVATLAPYRFLIWDDQRARVIKPAIAPDVWRGGLDEPPAAAIPRPTPPEYLAVDVQNLWR